MLLTHETRWQLRMLLRDRTAAFFTLIFPIVLLILLARQVGKDHSDILSMGITVAVVMASFPALAISLAAAVENGVLHRLRTTPLPLRIHLAGRMAASGVLTIVSVVMVIIAAHLMGFGITQSNLLGLMLPLALGWLVASAWGLFVGAYTRKVSSASFLTQILLFPLYILESFLIAGGLPGWLEALALWSPLHQLVATASASLGGNLLTAWTAVVYLTALALVGFLLAAGKLRTAR